MVTDSSSFAGSRNGQGDVPTGARALNLWHAKCCMNELELPPLGSLSIVVVYPKDTRCAYRMLSLDLQPSR